ncbi:MAG: thioredoxin [Mobiluncus porci]|uniref:Thioredoxin n=1 Tax=Mobiluncus porci TaxID=2652278 RepID=A0A7K0K004_9ACTO|nr:MULTISPECIES: thioredoxin [Mobiluncus]MCI6584622.1 thioredoxin [Mobiluncus sp.]MDD7541537.1 thioredoxin [Mobiluncus porci]MDY5748522.1 thioredoxin [Mobiluncus porci]MST48718.1 thioredoxin [Mobiluncus porci]
MSEKPPSPASLNAEDLTDFREEIAASEDAPLEEQLDLLKHVTAELQTVLQKD